MNSELASILLLQQMARSSPPALPAAPSSSCAASWFSTCSQAGQRANLREAMRKNASPLPPYGFSPGSSMVSLFFGSPTAESFGVSAQIGSGVDLTCRQNELTMMSVLLLGLFHVKFGVVVRLAGDCGKLRLEVTVVRKQKCGRFCLRQFHFVVLASSSC